MSRRAVLVMVSLVAAALAPEARAQYRYGGYSGAEDQGFILELEALAMTPLGADTVVATAEGGQATAPLVIDWDDEVAGRVGLGYKWANGNQLLFHAWGFRSEEQATGSAPAGGRLYFPIGPPIPHGSDYLGGMGDPGSYVTEAEIRAGTADLAWGRDHELSEGFHMEWNLGLRYLRYEERQAAAYDEVAGFDPGSGPVAAGKTIDNKAYGARAAVRGTYRFSTHWSLGAGLGFSFLQGRADVRSGLAPQGTVGGSPVGDWRYELADDDLSGSTRDFDLTFAWHTGSDSLRVYLGWEQQRWEDVVADPARNFPGTGAPLGDRDHMTFSGYKLGLRLVF